jgi:hypothetical protein
MHAHNGLVAGSSPAGPTNKTRHFSHFDEKLFCDRHTKRHTFDADTFPVDSGDAFLFMNCASTQPYIVMP